MIPIRVKYDGRYQSFKLVESYNGPLFEEGEEYCLVPATPNTQFDPDGDSFDETYLH